MKVIRNRVLPLPGFKAMMFMGCVFTRKRDELSEVTLNHEAIHAAQERELWYVGFWAWYVCEWLWLCIKLRNAREAYKQVRFEKEAYSNEKVSDYLVKRKAYSWRKL
jgi:hypothetical protein